MGEDVEGEGGEAGLDLMGWKLGAKREVVIEGVVRSGKDSVARSGMEGGLVRVLRKQREESGGQVRDMLSSVVACVC